MCCKAWDGTHYAVSVSHEAIELGDLEGFLEDLLRAFGDQIVVESECDVHGGSECAVGT